jgi:ankyrin repeat protein
MLVGGLCRCDRVLAAGRRVVSAATLVFALVVQAIAGPNEDILAAAKTGDRMAVEAALAAGASVNAVDGKGLSPLGLSGLTPLGLAAAYGHRNVVELLLNQGANISAADVMGQTPLHLAAEYGSADVAALLLEHGAGVDVRDKLGSTPLQWAAVEGHKNVASLLIKRGAIVNAQNLGGRTALHLAATEGHKEVVALLLAHGPDVRIRSSNGQTPLQEMQTSSSIDPATKAKIAAMLGAKPAPRQVHNSVTARSPVAPTPLSAPPTPVYQEPQQSGTPACTDAVGLARVVMQANPGIPPQVLAVTVQKLQVTMGCR